MFWCTKSIKFHFWWGTKSRDQKQGTENDCDVNSGLQALRKTDFSDVFLFFHKQRTIVPFLSKLISSQENDWEICFSRGLKSWIDVTIVPSPLLLVSRFCTPPEVKFDAFGTSKHGKKNRYGKKKTFLLYLSVHWGDLMEQIKKKSVIYTSRTSCLGGHFLIWTIQICETSKGKVKWLGIILFRHRISFGT